MATKDISVIRDKKTGDIKNIRDKNLADAQVSTTPSDVTANSVVPVELEDGSCIKIKRDSLVQAFASVLNSNSQSTITSLFGADANGNHANINMANLASVLSGAMHVAITSITNDPAVEDWLEPVKRWYATLPDKTIAICYEQSGWGGVLYGYKASNAYGGFIRNIYGDLARVRLEGGTWSVIALS